MVGSRLDIARGDPLDHTVGDDEYDDQRHEAQRDACDCSAHVAAAAPVGLHFPARESAAGEEEQGSGFHDLRSSPPESS